jgi:hypothetical protein
MAPGIGHIIVAIAIQQYASLDIFKNIFLGRV